MQMGLLPYLKFSNMHEVGKVDENGLEEWAPWVGSSNTISASAQSRTPALTLSTYNRLVDLFRVMSLVEYTASPMAVPHGLIDRLEEWEATALTAAIPGIPGSSEMTATPAALLLQAFYRCCRLFLQPANNWAQSMFDVLDSFQVMFAGVALPPVVHSLLDIAGRVISSSPQNDSLRARLESIYAVFDSTWRGRPDVQPATRFRLPTGTHDPGRVFEARRNPPRSSFGSTVQIPTPESVQMSADQSLLVGTHFRYVIFCFISLVTYYVGN